MKKFGLVVGDRNVMSQKKLAESQGDRNVIMRYCCQVAGRGISHHKCRKLSEGD